MGTNITHADKSFRKLDSAAFVGGLWIVFTLGLVIAVSAVELLMGLPVNALTFPIALVAPPFLLMLYSERRTLLRAAVAVSLLWASTLLIGSFTFDYSHDGYFYHQESIFSFFQGDNLYLHPGKYDHCVWVLHYAKGMELIAANLMALTGNIESGKAANFMLGMASAMILWHIAGGMSRKQKVVLIGLVLANPVYLSQLFTYYIDFVSYFLIILTISLTVALYRGLPRSLCLAGLAVVIELSAAVKFNAFFFEGLTILAVLIWIWWKDGLGSRLFKSLLITSLLAAAVSACVVCWHPYITNIITHGHPLYPLMGEGKMDIMTDNTPEMYFVNDRVTSFLYSYFIPHPAHSPTVYDTRFGGFGIFSFLLFPIAIATLVYYPVRNRRMDAIAYTALCVIVSAFIFEQSWWARYIPQVWLLVPLSYLYLCRQWKKFARYVRGVLTLLAVATAAIVLWVDFSFVLPTCSDRTTIAKVFSGKTIRVYDYDDHGLDIMRRTGITPVPMPSDSLSEDAHVIAFYTPAVRERIRYYMLMEVTEEELELYENEREKRSISTIMKSMFKNNREQ